MTICVSSTRRARTATRATAAGLAIAATCAVALPHAEAAVVGPRPSPIVNQCVFLFSCQTTTIQFQHPKNDELDLYATWWNAANKPAAWATYTASCSDGTTFSQTISGTQNQYLVASPRDPNNPAVVTCTASQTIPYGYTTTATFFIDNPGYPPPGNFGYDFVRFAS